MKTYHKIQTVYKRDPLNKFKSLLIGDYSVKEFEYLKDCIWTFDEKVDGMNIRIMWDGENISFAGKTDRAQMPPQLLRSLESSFPKEKMHEAFGTLVLCLYGEGYGPKIQKGGDNYREDQGFVLFDVKVGDYLNSGIWLERKNVEAIGLKLGCDIAPIIGEGTLDQMVDITAHGFNSHWGSFMAEGIIARPKIAIKARDGERIITKIKHKDFR